MKRIKYILGRILKMDYKNMFKIAKKVSKRSHINMFVIIIDMVKCGFKYGAGYYDYQEFEFYRLTDEERRTYLTRTKNNLIISKYNNKNDFYLFDQKDKFNELFKDFLQRDYMVINGKNLEEFKKFVHKHKIIIVKPIDGEGGHGIMKYEVTEDANVDVLYDTLIKCNQLLVEDCIKQHRKINTLYSGSVNTMRLFTFLDGDEVNVLNSVFKLGNGGVTDNFSSGSMYTFLNDEGVVIAPAVDQNDDVYEYHPITKKDIYGFKVPFYEEACQMVKEAAKVVPSVRYVGWDVAITNKGPVIIEGNCFPGVFQIRPSFDRSHTGIIPKYKKYMKDIDL